MNNITIRNIEPQNIKISGAGEVIGITAVYVNGVNVTEGTVAYVIVPTKTSELVNNSGYITNETDPTVPYYVKNISISDISKWNNKQDELVSGVNIKTINSNSLLGSGNIDISASYSAGTGIEITEENVINNTITSYDDLDNLPTIPTKISDLTNDSDFVESSELAEVAFNGSYLALSNTPANTSDFTNDGEDGINPFITNQTDGLVNYFDKDFLFNILPKSTGNGSSINLTDTVKNAPMYLTLGATALSQDGTPTPSSPQDIHTISGSNKVVVCGKNLIGLATQLNGYVDASTLKFEDGTITGSSATNSVGYYFKTSQLPDTITINNIGGNRMNVCYFNDIPAYNVSCLLRSASNSNPRTITIDKTYNYVHIQMSFNDVNVSNIMVNYGDTALPYEPYTSQEADIDLDTLEYCKIGTYEDKFIRSNDGTWQLEKNIGKYDSWETIVVSIERTNTISYQFKLDYPTTQTLRPLGISNCFQNLINNDDNEHLFVGTSTGSSDFDGLNVFISKTRATTEEEAKQWLISNNANFYYILATPTYTQITGTLETQLETIYKDLTSESEQTNISQVNADLPFTISATTLKSLANL